MTTKKRNMKKKTMPAAGAAAAALDAHIHTLFKCKNWKRAKAAKEK